METKELTEDVLCNPFGFRLTWKYTEGHAEFNAYEIVARRNGEVPLFERSGSTSSEDMVDSIDEAELYMTALIKWDGCSHVRHNDYYHFCGKGDFKKHIKLLKYVYDKSFLLMGSEDEQNEGVEWQ